MMPIATDVACIVLCLVATAWDLRTGEIPDWLTVPAGALGLVLNTVPPTLASGWGAGMVQGLLPALGACLALLTIFGFLGYFDLVGMGDVKLLAAVGALLAWPMALWAAVHVLAAGGVLAIAWALNRGALRHSLQNVGVLLRRLAGTARVAPEVPLTAIPYGPAVLLGVAWVVVGRYLG